MAGTADWRRCTQVETASRTMALPRIIVAAAVVGLVIELILRPFTYEHLPLGSHSPQIRPSRSIPTVLSMRRCRVSAFLASSIESRNRRLLL